MAAGYRTAYGLDWAGGRMVLARSGGRDGADVLVSAALDSEAAHLRDYTLNIDWNSI